MMEFSAPTTASHPRNSVTSLGAPTTAEEEDRDVKRRKMVQQQQQQQDVPDISMMDTTMSTVTTAFPAQQQEDMTTMEMDSNNNIAVPQSSLAPGYYAHPSTCNMFNGNALSDEELVYQVLQSGAQTYAEVVQFCVRHGISVSRVLQMDLMGRLTYLRAA